MPFPNYIKMEYTMPSVHGCTRLLASQHYGVWYITCCWFQQRSSICAHGGCGGRAKIAPQSALHCTTPQGRESFPAFPSFDLWQGHTTFCAKVLVIFMMDPARSVAGATEASAWH